MKKNEREIDELINLIKHNDTYQKYLHVLKQVEDNADIKHLVDEVKQLQKEAVKEELLKHTKRVAELDDMINNKIKALEVIPLYVDYLEIAEEVNKLICDVKDKIQGYIDTLNTE